jgi:hypothetical protein
MPVPEPVAPLEPWQTAWPAGLALIGFVVAAWRSRRHFDRAHTDRWLMLLLFGVSVVVRLWVLPAASLHYFDGHEAEYWDIFRGVRPVNRGGTVLYPSMQWMWWGLGRVLPHHRLVPVVVMVGMGSAGVALVAEAMRVWTGRLGALLAGLVLALHPVLGAWSSSAYNVMVPWFFSAVLIWSASRLAAAHRPALSLVWVASFAWALVVSTRMEAAWVGGPALLAAMVGDASKGGWRARMLRLRWWPLPVGVALAVAAAAVVPLVFPGEVPGAGERALSFCINQLRFAPYAPYDSMVGGVAVAGMGVAAVRHKPVPVLVFGVATVLAHLVLATFDDFGDRHALAALFFGALLVAAACEAPLPFRWLGWGGTVLVGILTVDGLVDTRGRFYGSEEAFAALLGTDPRWSDLPRWSAEEARETCGWVAEDPRVAPQPQKSHFNLIDPGEADALRGPDGCLRWCIDVQDWRWSSRGVRDRALRTADLFDTRPVAVVEDAGSGYACLVMELGPRRRCRSPHPTSSREANGSTTPNAPPASGARSLEEDDALGSFRHTQIP